MKTTLRLLTTAFCSLASVLCTAQIVAPTGANQFRTTLATGGTYILRDTGTYYKTPGSWTFTDMTFSNTGAGVTTEAAVYVDGGDVVGSAVFTGSNLEILAEATSGNARRGFMIYRGGVAYLTDSIIRQTASDAAAGVTGALYLNGGGSFYGNNLLIEANGPQMAAILINHSLPNLVVLENTLIRNTGSAAVIDMAGSGAVLLNSCTVNTAGPVASGVLFRGGMPRFALTDGLIHVTGANSPGLWMGVGAVGYGVAKVDATFTNAVIRADNGMGIEVNTDLPGLVSRPAITGALPTWAGYFDITVVSSTISGALGVVRMTSSSTLGVEIQEITTSVRMTLQNSALDGDVFVNDGAQFIFNATASRLDGALRLSGTAPIAEVALDNFTLTNGITLSGGAALDLSANATTITGTLTADGSSTAKLRLTEGSTIDAVAFSGNSTLELTMDNTSRILGDFSFAGGATYTLLPADDRALIFSNPLTLATGGNLRVAPGTNLTLASPLTFADQTGVVTLADARGDDLVLAAGLAGRGRLIVQSIHIDALGQSELRVVRDDTGSLAPDSFALAAPASNRLFAYHKLENRPDGAYLTEGGFSPAGAAMLDTPALAAADFFDAMVPVFRHLSGLREGGTTNERPSHADADAGAFWLTGRSAATTANGAARGLAFNQQTFTFATGADLRWGGGRDEPLFTGGVFADTGFTSRDFDNDASGNATIFGAGLYGLYQHTARWHIAANARFESTKNDFDTRASGATLSGDNTVRSAGLALEFGWRLSGFSSMGWWVEPSIGAGLANIGSTSYDAHSTSPGNRFHVEQNASSAAQGRGQIAFGCDLDRKWSLRAHIAASYLNISGGKLSTTTDGVTTTADATGIQFHQLDGSRVEAAVGLVYHLGSSSRLWLDCDTAFAADCNRPWSLSLGFAKAW